MVRKDPNKKASSRNPYTTCALQLTKPKATKPADPGLRAFFFCRNSSAEETKEAKDKRVKQECELRRITACVKQLWKNIDAASVLVEEGTSLPEDMRAAAQRIEQGDCKDLGIYRFLVVIVNLAPVRHLSLKVKNAPDLAARRSIIAKILRDMADSLDKFAVYCYKEHFSAASWDDDLKVLTKQLEESRKKGTSSCSSMCDDIARKIMELRVRLQRLQMLTAVVTDIAERKAVREAADKLKGLSLQTD